MAGDFPSPWRTVGLASRRHRDLLLPQQFQMYSTTFLDSVNNRKPLAPMRRTVPNREKPGLREVVSDDSRHEPFCTVLRSQRANLLMLQESILPVKPGRPIFSLEAIRPWQRVLSPMPVIFISQNPQPAPSGWKAVRRGRADRLSFRRVQEPSGP